ncbi:MAG: hypothetical protein CVV41_04085 [Candidatus Riflebacteria bacterium HGW-Riflebacteria-1]|jgi:hypothetical protein|nr:MAG: hypothetical protein CVV41_04085 [Candidatus Riflebacteria bacterium HGW-Riflebacteria-1]
MRREFLQIAFLLMVACFLVTAAANAQGTDLFADLETAAASTTLNLSSSQKSSGSSFFKNEIMTQFSFSSDNNGGKSEPYHRHSYGFELLKRFADEVSTTSSFNVQTRLVFRRNYMHVGNDMEGETRPELFLEYHNLYFDLYNALDSWMAPEARARNLGRFNFRFGRLYLPFGLNLQTDTHATILQLSNDRNFGFERDWYAGFWGSVNDNLNYDLYYMLGSGYDIARKGQSGLLGARISLANKYLYEHGLEGGLAVITGERLSKHAVMRSHSVMAAARNGKIVDTLRVGIDGRYGRAVPGGKMTLTGELSTGKDESDDVLTQLYQVDFLRADRKFGWATQYRRFWQETLPNENDDSLIGELTWYMKNDVGNASLEWIKLNVEKKLSVQSGSPDTITTVQYYRYW